MRINRFVAQATGISRRAADQLIEQGKITVNGQASTAGQDVSPTDRVVYNGNELRAAELKTILLNKPVGYVCSRDGQGSQTIYELLPTELHNLKPVGRLDKYSSGLLLLTNDGQLAQNLTHPSHQKTKIYEVQLAQNLQPLHRQMIADRGIQLDDGPSKFQLERITDSNEKFWRVRMHEGRNRQIRRTFAALGYQVTGLRRTHFGSYMLQPTLPAGAYELVR